MSARPRARTRHRRRPGGGRDGAARPSAGPTPRRPGGRTSRAPVQPLDQRLPVRTPVADEAHQALVAATGGTVVPGRVEGGPHEDRPGPAPGADLRHVVALGRDDQVPRRLVLQVVRAHVDGVADVVRAVVHLERDAEVEEAGLVEVDGLEADEQLGAEAGHGPPGGRPERLRPRSRTAPVSLRAPHAADSRRGRSTARCPRLMSCPAAENPSASDRALLPTQSLPRKRTLTARHLPGDGRWLSRWCTPAPRRCRRGRRAPAVRASWGRAGPAPP